MPVHGIIHGIDHGVIHGISRGVPHDGPENWAVPVSAAEFVALGQPAANSVWPCQESSGNLVDPIGGLTLTAAGSPTYQNAVTGWNRKALGFAENGSDAFRAAAGVGPNPTATSTWWIFYVDLLANPAAVRQILTAGGAAGASEETVRANTSSGLTLKSGGNSSASGGDYQALAVFPVVLVHNRADGPSLKAYTKTQIITVTYVAATDGNKGIGASLVTAPAMRALWGAMWSGANAELTDGQTRTRMQALGINVSW